MRTRTCSTKKYLGKESYLPSSGADRSQKIYIQSRSATLDDQTVPARIWTIIHPSTKDFEVLAASIKLMSHIWGRLSFLALQSHPSDWNFNSFLFLFLFLILCKNQDPNPFRIFDVSCNCEDWSNRLSAALSARVIFQNPANRCRGSVDKCCGARDARFYSIGSHRGLREFAFASVWAIGFRSSNPCCCNLFEMVVIFK